MSLNFHHHLPPPARKENSPRDEREAGRWFGSFQMETDFHPPGSEEIGREGRGESG